VAALSDGDVNTVALDLPASTPGNESWVQFDYGHPQTIQAVTLASLNDAISVFDHESPAVPPYLEASDDGVSFASRRHSFQQHGGAHGFVRRGDRALLPPRLSRAAGRRCRARPQNHELVLASGARVKRIREARRLRQRARLLRDRDPKLRRQFIVPQAT
jgi:hypothetical protein